MKLSTHILDLYRNILFLAALGCTLLTACDDDDVTAVPLNKPSVTCTEDETSVSRLSFSWEAVPGAVQYAYQLFDPNGITIGGNTTTETSARFSLLRPQTTYTLKVWAYASLENPALTTSPIAVLTATTASIVTLEAPTHLVLSTDHPTTNSQLTLSWDDVAHAGSYSYTLTSESGELIVNGTTEEASTSFALVQAGQYTCTVIALSNNEAYSDSEPVTLTFDVTDATYLWQAEGVYQCQYNQATFAATLSKKTDGSYTITHAMSDFTFEFYVEEDGLIYPTDESWVYEEDGSCWNYINNNYVYFYPNNSTFTEGRLTLYYYDYGIANYSFDSFTWSAVSEE